MNWGGRLTEFDEHELCAMKEQETLLYEWYRITHSTDEARAMTRRDVPHATEEDLEAAVKAHEEFSAALSKMRALAERYAGREFRELAKAVLAQRMPK